MLILIRKMKDERAQVMQQMRLVPIHTIVQYSSNSMMEMELSIVIMHLEDKSVGDATNVIALFLFETNAITLFCHSHTLVFRSRTSGKADADTY